MSSDSPIRAPDRQEPYELNDAERWALLHGERRSLGDAILCCAVRSAVMRASNPAVKYWKNHSVPIAERVPMADREATDWVEYDPRDEDPHAGE